MAPLNDLWTDDAKKDIYASVESACHNEKGDYYEYPLCMTAHCMAVNMTKVKEVGADKYIDTDKHTWGTEGFLNTVDALYKGGYENVAAIYCSGQGGDQGTRAIINNMYGGTFTDAAHTKYTADSARTSRHSDSVRCKGRQLRSLHQRRRGDHPVPQRHPADGFLLEHCTAAER